MQQQWYHIVVLGINAPITSGFLFRSNFYNFALDVNMLHSGLLSTWNTNAALEYVRIHSE